MVSSTRQVKGNCTHSIQLENDNEIESRVKRGVNKFFTYCCVTWFAISSQSTLRRLYSSQPLVHREILPHKVYLFSQSTLTAL